MRLAFGADRQNVENYEFVYNNVVPVRELDCFNNTLAYKFTRTHTQRGKQRLKHDCIDKLYLLLSIYLIY